jgi:hypothetical protein
MRPSGNRRSTTPPTSRRCAPRSRGSKRAAGASGGVWVLAWSAEAPRANPRGGNAADAHARRARTPLRCPGRAPPEHVAPCVEKPDRRAAERPPTRARARAHALRSRPATDAGSRDSHPSSERTRVTGTNPPDTRASEHRRSPRRSARAPPRRRSGLRSHCRPEAAELPPPTRGPTRSMPPTSQPCAASVDGAHTLPARGNPRARSRAAQRTRKSRCDPSRLPLEPEAVGGQAGRSVVVVRARTGTGRSGSSARSCGSARLRWNTRRRG